MRIAIVSDTHLPRGSRRVPAGCIERLEAADLIVHAGDFVSLAFHAEMLALGPPLAAVYGNVDDLALRERLPAERTVEAAGARIGLLHDAGPARGRLARMRRRFPDAHAVVFGHSHTPLQESDGTFQIFNPGSPTERRRAPRHTMGVATVGARRVRFEHIALD
ncbi:MAG: metallophosphatase family protein [Actinomycetota bacterium]|nr:metallophosphatase family protein [Actinomycetota bacterium]